jgi:hypothetical protein
MIRKKISVISLISYDAHLLADSISSYYNYVDEIVLGLDQDRISWSGNKFTFDEPVLWTQLKQLDVSKKISIVEDNFHRSKNPIENDTHERNFLKQNCTNDWIFSFDADEILVNAKDFFITFCPLVQDLKDIELMFTWFLMYKEFDDSILAIGDESRQHLFKKDIQGFSAHRDINTFTYCRWTNATKKILSPLAIKHNSFCRPETDLQLKINNFGHSKESKKDPFYDTQKLITKDNYRGLVNFKTQGAGAQWPTLMLLEKNILKPFLESEAKLIYA